MIKLYIGPMSKNVVDVLSKYPQKIGFILSRRQVEYDGGYVNNWTTEEFSKYVKKKGCKVARDHGGPWQGLNKDDGYDSFSVDCKYLDIIHVDPWKRYKNFKDGLGSTIEFIKYCFSINPCINFEVGTEEAIRSTTPEELELLLSSLKKELSPEMFNNIKYVVIQSGTSIEGSKNTGKHDVNRLVNMLKVCKKYNKLSKEHNGDFLNPEELEEKFKYGLDAINIAPEFGQLETKTILKHITSKKLFDEIFKMCYDSKKWVKWVDKDFEPFKNKVELITISGHYMFANERFQKIKNTIPNIDEKIRKAIENRVQELFSVIYP